MFIFTDGLKKLSCKKCASQPNLSTHKPLSTQSECCHANSSEHPANAHHTPASTTTDIFTLFPTLIHEKRWAHATIDMRPPNICGLKLYGLLENYLLAVHNVKSL